MSMGPEYCTRCNEQLETGQIGLCDSCQEDDAREHGNVATYHQVLCPKCGGDQRLEVVAQLWVRLVEDGTDDSECDHDQTYDEAASACCRACGWHGLYCELSEAFTRARRSA